MFRIFLVFCSLLLVAPCIGFCEQERVAVFVGVNVYPKPGFDPLRFAEQDVERAAVEFKNLGFRVVVLKGSLPATSDLRATRSNIVTQIQKLMKPLDGDDMCVVMFSGHGLQFTPSEQTDEDAFFCPVDAVKNDPTTLLSLNYVIDTLLNPQVGHKLLIVDACRVKPKTGATVGKGIQGSDKVSLPSKTSVLFSCSARQESFETDKLGNGTGIFTYCLLDGLRGAAADDKGQLTWSRLVAHVEDKMESDEVRKIVTNQHPILAGNAGRVVLGKVAVVKRQEPGTSGTTASGFSGTIAGEARALVADTVFHWCPPGKFTMGTPGATDDEAPAEVTQSSGFWMCETEVTQGQWTALMSSTPWQGKSYVKEGPKFAASYVSHDDAVAYCKKLTDQERKAGRLPSGWTYALPTEAQWEYACRAGTKTKFSFGDDEKRLGDYAWYVENADKIKQEYAHEVGQKKANDWGLKDMHGNVWEWCADWYQSKLPGGRDPAILSEGSLRVFRGGGWDYFASNCRSAIRFRISPDFRLNDLGFRVAVVPSSP